MDDMNNEMHERTYNIPIVVRTFNFYDPELKWGQKGTVGYLEMHIDNVDAVYTNDKDMESGLLSIKNLTLNDKGMQILENQLGFDKDKMGWEFIIPELN